MRTPITNSVHLREGGATGPTVELYQRQSGRCRLWWYCFDQAGMELETIAVFIEHDWNKAVERAWRLYREFRSRWSEETPATAVKSRCARPTSSVPSTGRPANPCPGCVLPKLKKSCKQPAETEVRSGHEDVGINKERVARPSLLPPDCDRRFGRLDRSTPAVASSLYGSWGRDTSLVPAVAPIH